MFYITTYYVCYTSEKITAILQSYRDKRILYIILYKYIALDNWCCKNTVLTPTSILTLKAPLTLKIQRCLFGSRNPLDSTHHQEIPLNQGSALLAASNPGWNAACIVFEQSGRWLLVLTKWTTKTSTAHMQSGANHKILSPTSVYYIHPDLKQIDVTLNALQ